MKSGSSLKVIRQCPAGYLQSTPPGMQCSPRKCLPRRWMELRSQLRWNRKKDPPSPPARSISAVRVLNSRRPFLECGDLSSLSSASQVRAVVRSLWYTGAKAVTNRRTRNSRRPQQIFANSNIRFFATRRISLEVHKFKATEERTMIKRLAIPFCLLTAIAATGLAQQPISDSKSDSMSASTTQDKKSLYDRLGGYNAVAAVVDDFIGRLVADKRFTKFFVGHSEDSLKKIRQHIVDQFCAAAGGPCLYTGRDMKTSHKGLGITADDWDAAAKHLVESLDKFNVPKAEKDDLLTFVTSLRKDIVEK